STNSTCISFVKSFTFSILLIPLSLLYARLQINEVNSYGVCTPLHPNFLKGEQSNGQAKKASHDFQNFRATKTLPPTMPVNATELQVKGCFLMCITAMSFKCRRLNRYFNSSLSSLMRSLVTSTCLCRSEEGWSGALSVPALCCI